LQPRRFYVAAIYASADMQCNPCRKPHSRSANRDVTTVSAGAGNGGFDTLYGGKACRDIRKG
jgi:hypothetical protein